MKKVFAVLALGLLILTGTTFALANPFSCFKSDTQINNKYCNYYEWSLPGGELSFLRCDVLPNYNGSTWTGKKRWNVIIPE